MNILLFGGVPNTGKTESILNLTHYLIILIVTVYCDRKKVIEKA